MRDWIDWTNSWYGSIFSTPENVLDLCQSAYLLAESYRQDILAACGVSPDEDSLFDYIAKKRYRKDGFTKIRLVNFDFYKDEGLPAERQQFVQLFNVLSEEVEFLNATFSLHQFQLLMSLDEYAIHLKRSTYQIIEEASASEYRDLFMLCRDRGCLYVLNPLKVSFKDFDATKFDDDFIIYCQLRSLEGTQINQIQFF